MNLEGARWRKTSYSGGSSGNCVEVVSGVRAVRDSKNLGGGVLVLGESAAAAFVAAVKAGKLDA